jgi:16S rRNA (cytosine1402-N4)-methyltransferase
MARRRESAIESTSDLAAIVSGPCPRGEGTGGDIPHETFQALRIAVNREWKAFERRSTGEAALNRGGRFLVISYHSWRTGWSRNPSGSWRIPASAPGISTLACGRRKQGVVLTKKPLMPREEEVRRNPRARSARLRVMERI